MSRPRTRIRRMWITPHTPAKHGYITVAYHKHFASEPHLVIPDNPAARRAMVVRTVKAICGDNICRPEEHQMVESILEAALSP